MYQYDLFLSYPRRPPVSDWVHTHFLDRLTEWLRETLDEEPSIFVDQKNIETGQTWPLVLRQALLTSRLLIPIWSPSYFRSKWCMAELRTMLAREQLLELRTPQRPSGLILPIQYHDGKRFPSETEGIEMRDFTRYNVPTPGFRDTSDYTHFIREVQEFADEVAETLNLAPSWQADWPVELPEVPSSFDFGVPRL
jgi:hypothetical protein